MTGLAPALVAALTVLLLVRGPGRLGRSTARPAAPTTWTAAGVSAGAAALILLLDGRAVVVGILGLAVVVVVSRELASRRRSTDASRRADQVLAACDGLASELAAGQPPAAALVAAVDDWPELAGVAAAAELGADVPEALRALAGRPGAAQARVVAAAWQVAHRTGAGLASALSAAAAQLRAERATARVVATELAAARATARLLAVLPLGVLLLGGGLGGDPLGFLLGTTPGVVCLSLGLALEYVGLRWLARIGDTVLGRR